MTWTGLQPTSVPLRTRTEMVLETLVLPTFNHLTRLVAEENFIKQSNTLQILKLLSSQIFCFVFHHSWRFLFLLCPITRHKGLVPHIDNYLVIILNTPIHMLLTFSYIAITVQVIGK
jgi:hypothetical protein